MYDIAVIGLGPAGLEVVDVAIKNNLSVVAFEKNELGGTCLNVGCIPTKSILHSANVFRNLKQASRLGLSCENVSYSWPRIIEREKMIVSKFTKALELNLTKKIKLIKADAQIMISPQETNIIADDNIYEAKNIIIATGSIPVELPGLEFDGDFVLSSDDLYGLSELPKSIIIVGSGAIGLEWAYILSSFGVKVTLIEKAQAISPNSDVDIQKRLERFLKLNNIDYYKNDYIVEVLDHAVKLSSGVVIEADKILSAVGRKPLLPLINYFGCNEACKLSIEDDYSTEFQNIFVVGDANKESMLAHSASFQAKVVMNKILFDKEIIKKQYPNVIYIHPEIASIGLTEQDVLNNAGYYVKKILLGSIAKSWCDDSSDGIIKIILKDDLIVGAHIISNEASSLISIFEVLIDRKIPISEVSNMIFPHPSYAEAILEVLK